MALKTLIFDDDELIRSTLAFFLESEGCEVYAFEKPDQCPYYLYEDCKCDQNSYCADIIITDINMPGSSGIEFVENQIRNGCKVKNIAVMSAEWDGPHLARAEELGCKVFHKPFSIIDLRDWLNSVKENIKKFNFQAAVHAERKPAKKGKKDRLLLRLPSSSK